MKAHLSADICIRPVGETGIKIEFGHVIDISIHQQVKLLTDYLDQHPMPGMIEYVAAFTSVTVFFDLPAAKAVCPPGQPVYQFVGQLLRQTIETLPPSAAATPRTVEIPVCYGGEFGPDLAYVAKHNKMTAEQVIALHAGGDYLVYMLGFAPGFPYLGGMPAAIATPRRQSPRLLIPAGSVGIAGSQTGMYPIATPGGWQLIGRTPLALFRPDQNPPTLLKAGDMIKFRPINEEQYAAYEKEAGL